jgi:Nif-specific regulatory protein
LTLLEFFVHHFAKKVGKHFRRIDKRTLELFSSYDWPGNIRELENAIERAIVIGNSDLILPEDLPDALADRALPISDSATNFQDAVRDTKKHLILTALEQSEGSFTQAAKLLGLHPNYLHRLVANLDLKGTLKNAAKR